MFDFLNLGTQLASRWLNAEQGAGQAESNITIRKRELRKILQESREKLKQDTLASGQPWGAGHLLQLENFLHSQGLLPSSKELCGGNFTCGTYWPINSELKLLPDGEQLRTSSVRWLLPKTAPAHQLEWFNLTANVGSWPTDKHGLPQPTAATHIEHFGHTFPAPWIIVTPCLAADREGFRLGYGGGYYDRFISLRGRECLLIACVPHQHFFETDLLPRQEHDERVDLVITEKTVRIINGELLENKIKLFDQLLNKARG
jgi:5-formyltetrahydrofolate cyclo-ligase